MKVEIEIRARGRTFNSKTIFFIRQLKSSPLFSPRIPPAYFFDFPQKTAPPPFLSARARKRRPSEKFRPNRRSMDKQNSTPSHFCADLPFKIQYETKNSSLPCPKKSGSLHWNRFFLQYICRPIFRASRKPPRAQARRLQPQPPPVPARCKSGCRSPRFRP